MLISIPTATFFGSALKFRRGCSFIKHVIREELQACASRSTRFIIKMANGIFAVPGQSVAVIIKSSKVGGAKPTACLYFSHRFFALAAGALLVYILPIYVFAIVQNCRLKRELY
jgi:hypothetical protein